MRIRILTYRIADLPIQIVKKISIIVKKPGSGVILGSCSDGMRKFYCQCVCIVGIDKN